MNDKDVDPFAYTHILEIEITTPILTIVISD